MEKLQNEIYKWFLEKKEVALLFAQVQGLIELFEDGINNTFFTELKVEINAWTGVELKVWEIRELDGLIYDIRLCKI